MDYRYRAFGLTLASDFPCPRLSPASGPADVVLRYGPVPRTLEGGTGGVLYQIRGEQCLLRLEQIAGARYLVRDGREIIIERSESSDDETVALFLFGSCMGALLYQRSILPMHGSAVATPAGAVLITGVSGSGKSTLAAALAQRGFAVLTDDICAVTLDENNIPFVHPGYPGLKLWADVLSWLGAPTGSLSRVRPELAKYFLPLNGAFVDEALPLRAVYILEPSNVSRPIISPMQGMSKMTLIRRNAYRVEYVPVLGRQSLLFRYTSTLAQHGPVYRVERPRHGFLLDELTDSICYSWT